MAGKAATDGASTRGPAAATEGAIDRAAKDPAALIRDADNDLLNLQSSHHLALAEPRRKLRDALALLSE